MDTEQEAVTARDMAVYLYNKEHGTKFHINIPINESLI